MNPEQITKWKQQYGKIFAVSIGNSEYIFREITGAEFDAAMSVKSEGIIETEDALVKKALLHPADLDFDRMPAGLISSLLEEILNVSGYGDPSLAKRVLDESREKAQEVRGLMKAFVLATMGSYTEEDLDAMSFSRLAAKVALAEQVLKVTQASLGIDNEVTLDLVDLKEEAQKEALKAKRHEAVKKPGQASYNDPIANQLMSALRE